MRQCVRLSLTLCLLTLTSVACTAQDKVTLTYKATKGQIVRYKSAATLNLDAGGMKIELETKQTEKTTVTDVSANGDITKESMTESLEISFNGEKRPTPEEAKSTTTTVVHSDGTLVSVKSSRDEGEQGKIGVRLSAATHPIYSAKPVGVGDKWSYEVKADANLGTEKGTGDAEVLGFEKAADTDAVKIKLAYKEEGHDPALSVNGTLWIDKVSGEIVRSEYEVANLQFGGEQGPMVAGKFKEDRTEGATYLAPKTGGQTDTKPGAKTDTKPDAKPEPKKEKTIDEVVKDYEKLPGFLTLYRKKESGRETLYMEIPEALLDKLMMMEATASTGTGGGMNGKVVAGDPLNDILFKFVKSDGDKILFVEPNIAHRTDEKLPIARALKRSYPEAYLESFKIEARQDDRKSLLIDVSSLFKGDIAQISERFSGSSGLSSLLGGGGGSSYSMDREKTYISAIKNFPENLVVETNYHFSSTGRSMGGGLDQLADPRSIPFKVVYTVFPLPVDNGYVPRLADSRVGYFLTDFQEYGDDSREDVMTRYIYRWDMRKKDPNAPLSEPVKPIVFWMDNAIPTEYRPWVKEGLLMWNKAFEKVGIKNAIVVNQMPDNADWDHADMRYNTIRWVASPNSGYAVAQFRVNPITGQVLNANITVDANFTRYIKQERREDVNPASYFDDPTPAQIADALKHPYRCEFGAGMVDQGWFGYEALSALAPQYGMVDDKEYLHQYLREVVGHEMGHIMGLRHNFIASTYHTADELKDAKLVEETGVSSSLMEYGPFNIYALKQKGVPFYSPTVGPYDIWAIQYGYTNFNAQKPTDEKSQLKAIAAKCNEPGHSYESDEIVLQAFDPAVVQFDLARDPLAYWTKSMQVDRFLLFNLDKRKPKNGESYHEFTVAFNRLLGQYSRAASVTSRYIGGLHVTDNYRGDSGEKPVLVPVSGAEQRKALELLNTYIFSDSAFNFPKRYYTMLADEPFGELSLATLLGGGNPAPVRDQMASIQAAALRRLFSPAVLDRVANNEFKAADNAPLKLSELFPSVRKSVWEELGAHKNIGALHRQLQRTHLDTLITMAISPAGGTPEDAKMLAWNELRQLKTQIAAASKFSAQYDTYTQVHLDEALMRVNRALDAKQMIGGASSARSSSLLDLLLGGDKKP